MTSAQPASDPQGIIADAVANPSENEAVARDRLFMWLIGLERGTDPTVSAASLLARPEIGGADGNPIVPLLREVAAGGAEALGPPRRRGGREARIEQT